MPAEAVAVGASAMALNASAVELELNHVRRLLVGRAKATGLTPTAVVQEHRAYREGIQRAQRAGKAEWQLHLLTNRDIVAARSAKTSVWQAPASRGGLSSSAAVPRGYVARAKPRDDQQVEEYAQMVDRWTQRKRPK